MPWAFLLTRARPCNRKPDRRSRAPCPCRLSAPAGYLQKILTARVYDVAIESALDDAPRLSARLGNRVLLKREDTQPVFSFKLRGAYNKMAHLAGRGAGAWRDLRLGRQPRARRRARGQQARLPGDRGHADDHAFAQGRRRSRAFGGEVVLHGDSYSDAYARALELETKRAASPSCIRSTIPT